MAKHKIPSADFLRTIFSYNPDTGELRWKPRTPDTFDSVEGSKYTAESRCRIFNSKFAGKLAGSVGACGYITVQLNGQHLKAHRIIFVMMTGEQPKDEIDHINHCRSDNRWSNLRDVSKRQNSLNQKRHSTNSTGVTGVSYLKNISKYVAYICKDNEQIRIGYYESLDDAAEARRLAEIEYGFHPNHGRSAPVVDNETVSTNTLERQT